VELHSLFDDCRMSAGYVESTDDDRTIEGIHKRIAGYGC
jgi:hypothetical protein